jgi:hypothetical protein
MWASAPTALRAKSLLAVFVGRRQKNKLTVAFSGQMWYLIK